MKQSFWDDSCLASQEIPYLLQALKVHYYIHKSQPLDPILSWLISDYTHTPCLRSILTISPIHAQVSLVVYFLQVFEPQSCIKFSTSHACYMSRPAHPSWFDEPNKLISSSLCFLHSLVTSYLFQGSQHANYFISVSYEMYPLICVFESCSKMQTTQAISQIKLWASITPTHFHINTFSSCITSQTEKYN
jgi:hypothetical protein